MSLVEALGVDGKIAIWWLLFGGTHILGSTVPVRGFLIRTLGLRGFKSLYSLVAFATFIPLGYTYFTNKHAGAFLFEPSVAGLYLTQGLMLVALVILLQGLATPSPLTTLSEMTGRYTSEPRGIFRVTRHPQNLGFGLLGVAHCVSLPFVGDWLFFGGFAVYGVLSAVHQDRRTRATGPEAVGEFQARTSLFPFAAILSGKQRLAPREYSLPALVGAVVAFVVIRAFHAQLFGGFGG